MNKDVWVYGIHAVQSLAQNYPQNIVEVFVLEGRDDRRLQEILSLLQEKKVALRRCSRNELDGLVKGAQHQGIVARSLETVAGHENDLETYLDELTEAPFLLILDGVQDPHNLGACLRSANAAGVHAVITPKDNSAGITPAVRKVASGAVDSTPFYQVTNLARTLRGLKARGIWIYGATDEAETSLYETDLSGPIAWVLGAEGSGLRRLTKAHCDVLVSIPMAGTVSSLNVSVSTGICLYETVRQRC